MSGYAILKFAHICCCSSSYCGVPAFKLIHVLSLQASSDPTSDIGIVSFSSSIYVGSHLKSGLCRPFQSLNNDFQPYYLCLKGSYRPIPNWGGVPTFNSQPGPKLTE